MKKINLKDEGESFSPLDGANAGEKPFYAGRWIGRIAFARTKPEEENP